MSAPNPLPTPVSIPKSFALSARTTVPLPRGLAGQFVGAIGAAVIVAGGSWWTAPPAEGGRKVWEDLILARDSISGQRRAAGRLPHPVAYGATLSLANGVLLAGGQNADRAFPDVLHLSLRNGQMEIESWPSLPVPLVNCSIGMADRTIYVLGGQQAQDALSTNQVWSLALDDCGKPADQWHREPDAPFTGRILAASASCGSRLYIAGGAQLTRSSEGNPVRHYLPDAWSFQKSSGWVRLPDPPQPAVAAPASCASADHFMIFGGDNGHMAGIALKPGEEHPGFSRSIFLYRSETNTWTPAGELPTGLVTTGTALLEDGTIIIPGGEDRPGHRSAEVLELRID